MRDSHGTRGRAETIVIPVRISDTEQILIFWSC